MIHFEMIFAYSLYITKVWNVKQYYIMNLNFNIAGIIFLGKLVTDLLMIWKSNIQKLGVFNFA